MFSQKTDGVYLSSSFLYQLTFSTLANIFQKLPATQSNKKSNEDPKPVGKRGTTKTVMVNGVSQT